MLRLRLAGSCAAAVTTTVRFESSKDKSFKRRVDASKKVVDDLFRNRSSRKAQSAMLRQRELEVDSSDPRADPLGRAARSTSRPVTFADDITDAEEKASALTVPSAQGSAVLPIDDPDFSVLTDDAFAYFPEDKAHEQVVPGQSMPPDGMRRYRMEVQYRGDHYLGWDRASDMRRRRKELAVRRGESQSEEEAENVTWAGHALSGLRSAKDAVAESLAVALDAKTVNIYPSVALETGAHSRRLTCHVDIPANTLMQSRTIMQRAHAWLAQKEEPLGILSFQRAPPDFHASRSALNRVYVYRILNRISPAVLEVGQHWHVDRYLDVDLMQAAATNQLQGVRDFGAFASTTVERTVRREGTLALTRDLQEIRVTRQDDEVLIWFVAKSFLRHQIRHMVSALKFVGQRIWTEEDLRLMVDRSFSSAHHVDRLRPPPAPAHGLTLWEVQYPAAMGATPPYVDSGPIEDAISTTPAAVKRPSDALASNKK